MSKIRNSLGVLVLPVPSGDIDSYDAYKAKYGIDLDEIFALDDNDNTIVSPKLTKALYLRHGFNSQYANYVTPAFIMGYTGSTSLVVFYPSFYINEDHDTVSINDLTGMLVNQDNRTVQIIEL